MVGSIERLTLIAGILTVGSLFLCGFAGAIGYFNGYLSGLFIIVSICFFALIAYTLSVRALVFYKHLASNRSNSVKTGTLAIFSISSLLIAHTYFLYNNVSPSQNLLGNHDQGMYLAAAPHLKTTNSHAMATNWISESPVEFKRFLTKEISPSLKTESPGDITNTGTQAGFYLMDDAGSSQYIQFPPGYPTGGGGTQT